MLKKSGRLIVLANIKGGTGKSTIATNIAATAIKEGKTALLIDTDAPQFNTACWVSKRMIVLSKDDITCNQITHPVIQHNMKDWLKNYDYVIVDSGGSDKKVVRSAMVAAGLFDGLIIIPITTSSFDIWTANDTISVIEDAEISIDMKIKTFFSLNRVITGTLLEEKAENALKTFKQDHGIPMLKTKLHMRVDYIECLEDGQSVFEYKKKGEAATEIQALYDEINNVYHLEREV